MSDVWKQYLPVYRRLEDEFCDFTYYVSLEDNQLNVYSIHLSELLLRICSDLENVSKVLLIELGYTLDLRDNFPKIGKKLKKHMDFQNKSVNIVWSYQVLSDKIIIPLQDFGTKIPQWYTDYNNLKHNRANGGIKSATYGSVLYSLGALFLMNLELVKKCTVTDGLSRIEDGSIPSFTKLFHARN